MDGLRVIDADGHVEPGLVADWRHYIEGQAGRTIDEKAKRWYGAAGGGAATQRGGWDPQARLSDMDKEGIDTTVVFGSSKGVNAYADGDLGLAADVARGFNNWLHHYCSADTARLKAAAWVPLHDMGEACKEAHRAVSELGAAGVVINPFEQTRPLDDTSLFPLYEAAEGMNTPVLVHATGMIPGGIDDRYRAHFQRHAISFPVTLMASTMELVCGGVLERFPRLRVALLEGGVGWVPWWMDRLDEHFEKLPHHVPFIKGKPRDLLRHYIGEGRLVWTCEPGEAYLPHAITEVGEEAVCYASDYPHWDCEFPRSVEMIAGRGDIGDGAKRRVLRDNAARLYGFGD